jgi:hypothetical protein
MVFIVTCHTPNCENDNIGIEVINPEPTVICGACGVEITDKVEVQEEATKKASK